MRVYVRLPSAQAPPLHSGLEIARKGDDERAKEAACTQWETLYLSSLRDFGVAMADFRRRIWDRAEMFAFDGRRRRFRRATYQVAKVNMGLSRGDQYYLKHTMTTRLFSPSAVQFPAAALIILFSILCFYCLCHSSWFDAILMRVFCLFVAGVVALGHFQTKLQGALRPCVHVGLVHFLRSQGENKAATRIYLCLGISGFSLLNCDNDARWVSAKIKRRLERTTCLATRSGDNFPVNPHRADFAKSD